MYQGQAYANRKCHVSWLRTDLVLSRNEGSRRKFCEAQEAYIGKEIGLFNDPRCGLYLGSDEFAEECIRGVKGEE